MLLFNEIKKSVIDKQMIEDYNPLSSFKYKWLVKMESEPTYHLTVGDNAEQAMRIANGEFKLKVMWERWNPDKKEYVLVDKPSVYCDEFVNITIKATEAKIIGVTQEFEGVMSIPGSATKKKTSKFKEK